jgi:nucleotide-binding universal stress UspA family protein
MYKTILVPLDGWESSERSLPVARLLAERENAAIVLVMDVGCTVMSEPPEQYLERAADEAGIDAELRVTKQRDVAETLALVAAGVPDPLVVMTSHGRTGAAWVFSGSVSERVLRTLSVPVVLVGPAYDATRPQLLDTLLVCTDGSDAAEAVVPVARQWITDLNLESFAIEVIDRRSVDLMRDADADVTDNATLSAFAARLAPKTNWDVLHAENAGSAIAGIAASLPASLIAIATHGRSGIARMTVGSTTADVVRQAPCPVLVVPSASPTSD